LAVWSRNSPFNRRCRFTIVGPRPLLRHSSCVKIRFRFRLIDDALTTATCAKVFAATSSAASSSSLARLTAVPLQPELTCECSDISTRIEDNERSGRKSSAIGLETRT
jgi:hypothetical protein